jgi:hypothetical protein
MQSGPPKFERGSGGSGGGSGGSSGGGSGGIPNPPPAPADLDLRGIGLTAASVSNGDEVTVRSRVRNSGGESAHGVTVRFSVGGEEIGSATKSISGERTTRFETSATWSDLSALGVAGDSPTVTARLESGRSWAAQTATDSLSVAEVEHPGGGPGDDPYIPPDEGGGDPGDDPFEGIDDPTFDTPDPQLQGVGTTTWSISEGDEVTIRSRVKNVADVPAEGVTVRFTAGGEEIGRDTQSISARGEERFEASATWEDLAAYGLTGQKPAVRATLDSGPEWDRQTKTSGKLTVAAQGDENGDKNDESDSTWAVVPAMGNLSREQTTALTAAGILLLGVSA